MKDHEETAWIITDKGKRLGKVLLDQLAKEGKILKGEGDYGYPRIKRMSSLDSDETMKCLLLFLLEDQQADSYGGGCSDGGASYGLTFSLPDGFDFGKEDQLIDHMEPKVKKIMEKLSGQGFLDLLEEMIGTETAAKSHQHNEESNPISKYSYFGHLLQDGRKMGLLTWNEESRISHALAKEWLA